MDIRNILTPKTGRLVNLPVSQIRPNRAQPRRFFDEDSLRALADSIKENGLITPVSVRREGDGYELIAGERRLLAHKMLGLDTIPAIIDSADDEKSAVLALIENLQREDLDFLEEALAIKALLESVGTQKELAKRLGLSQPAIANKLRLFALPRITLERLAQAGFTERHARALLPLCEDERLEAAVTHVIEKRLTVTKTEKLVERLKTERPRNKSRILILKDLRLFTGAINRAVDVMKEAGIDATSTKTEDDNEITFTIVIPKSPSHRPHLVPIGSKAAGAGG